MKNKSVVLLAVLGVVFASFADAANKPRKRTRNANRVGAYAVGAVGQATFTGDQTNDEDVLFGILTNAGVPFRDVTVDTEDKDIGYQATFGFRFNRYFAAELGLVQLGRMRSMAQGELDFGQGFVPTNVKLDFSAGGPLMSVLGILPINDKFELFGRVGYLFTSAEREISTSVDGQRGLFGSSKGDSQDVVYGAGASFHFSPVYSARLEYQQLDEIGEAERIGTEDVNVIALGFVVRF